MLEFSCEQCNKGRNELNASVRDVPSIAQYAHNPNCAHSLPPRDSLHESLILVRASCMARYRCMHSRLYLSGLPSTGAMSCCTISQASYIRLSTDVQAPVPWNNLPDAYRSSMSQTTTSEYPPCTEFLIIITATSSTLALLFRF